MSSFEQKIGKNLDVIRSLMKCFISDGFKSALVYGHIYSAWRDSIDYCWEKRRCFANAFYFQCIYCFKYFDWIQSFHRIVSICMFMFSQFSSIISFSSSAVSISYCDSCARFHRWFCSSLKFHWSNVLQYVQSIHCGAIDNTNKL